MGEPAIDVIISIRFGFLSLMKNKSRSLERYFEKHCGSIIIIPLKHLDNTWKIRHEYK